MIPCIIHNWGQWEDVTLTFSDSSKSLNQVKECKRCGKKKARNAL